MKIWTCIYIMAIIVVLFYGFDIKKPSNKKNKYFIYDTNQPCSIIMEKDVDIVVRTLGSKGEICKIYGHRFANVDFDNRKCYICGKDECLLIKTNICYTSEEVLNLFRHGRNKPQKRRLK